MADFHITCGEFINYSTSLNAKHVQNKAARKAAANRPKKTRRSDIIRKPVVYPSFEKPSEYTISDAPAAPVAKKSE
jgi:hypothetical protein